MKLLYTIFIASHIHLSIVYAQQEDSIKAKRQVAQTETTREKKVFHSSYSKFLIPATFISYGALTLKNPSLKKLDQRAHDKISKYVTTKIPIDDYIQYAPAAAVYGLDLIGLKAKHNFRDRTIVMATSYFMVGAIIQTTKITTNVCRPDGSNNRSFPSGHTATAFAGAQMLFREYKDVSPYIGLTAYVVAAGTGVLRVLNKRHWVSDVVAGAGVGILCVETGYILLPAMHSILGISKQNKKLTVAPVIHPEAYGAGVTYTF